MARAASKTRGGGRGGASARALYDGMIAALRAADSLSYESVYHRETQGQSTRQSTCRLWMKKPNYARLEALQDGGVTGVLVLDGERFWIYWPKERPYFYPGDVDEEQHWQACRNVYMTKPAPFGRHSILHEAVWTGGANCILDPSTFHGYTDAMQPYLEGVTSLGPARISEEQCDGIEVSFMNHQRSWHLWLARSDHLPRRLQEVVRVAREIVNHETWSNISLNAAIPLERFVWTPPAGWREWQPPTTGEWLLRPGTPAPDFALQGAAGDRIALSDYRGKVVWLAIWRAG